MDWMGIDPEDLDISILKGAFDLKGSIDLALQEICKHDDVVLVLVDTSTAYRVDGDEDDNQLAKEWAQAALRRLLEHPNHPAVIAATHPVKNADRSNLLPRGGSSFVNEVDGNFTLWAYEQNDRGAWTQTVFHWQGKLRGIGFREINFGFFPHPHPPPNSMTGARSR
jgi:hypothetical protein